MKRSGFTTPLRRGASFALLPLALIACSHDGHKSDITLPVLSAGAHTIVVDGDRAAHDGTAFVGGDGAAYIVLGDDSDAAASVVYRRGGGNATWQRVPRADGDVRITSALDEPQSVAAWAMPATATGYRARIGERTAAFTLASDGTLAASGDGCTLSGTIAAADLGNAARAVLTFSGCDEDGDYDGIAYVDPDAPNAAFHIVVDNGRAIHDFYAYAP
ncbi:MAG TPA: hypothetical protein VFM56_09375 [Solimonas sp.]|nr:hypothetical protein [Solimonas sp.]